MTKRQALASIAIELHNQNRIALAALDVARAQQAQIAEIARAIGAIADGLRTGQAASLSTATGIGELVPVLERLMDSALNPPRRERPALPGTADPAPPASVRSQANGIAVEAEPR